MPLPEGFAHGPEPALPEKDREENTNASVLPRPWLRSFRARPRPRVQSCSPAHSHWKIDQRNCPSANLPPLSPNNNRLRQCVKLSTPPPPLALVRYVLQWLKARFKKNTLWVVGPVSALQDMPRVEGPWVQCHFLLLSSFRNLIAVCRTSSSPPTPPRLHHTRHSY